MSVGEIPVINLNQKDEECDSPVTENISIRDRIVNHLNNPEKISRNNYFIYNIYDHFTIRSHNEFLKELEDKGYNVNYNSYVNQLCISVVIPEEEFAKKHLWKCIWNHPTFILNVLFSLAICRAAYYIVVIPDAVIQGTFTSATISICAGFMPALIMGGFRLYTEHFVISTRIRNQLKKQLEKKSAKNSASEKCESDKGDTLFKCKTCYTLFKNNFGSFTCYYQHCDRHYCSGTCVPKGRAFSGTRCADHIYIRK